MNRTTNKWEYVLAAIGILCVVVWVGVIVALSAKTGHDRFPGTVYTVTHDGHRFIVVYLNGDVAMVLHPGDGKVEVE